MLLSQAKEQNIVSFVNTTEYQESDDDYQHLDMSKLKLFILLSKCILLFYLFYCGIKSHL